MGSNLTMTKTICAETSFIQTKSVFKSWECSSKSANAFTVKRQPPWRIQDWPVIKVSHGAANELENSRCLLKLKSAHNLHLCIMGTTWVFRMSAIHWLAIAVQVSAGHTQHAYSKHVAKGGETTTQGHGVHQPAETLSSEEELSTHSSFLSYGSNESVIINYFTCR